AHAKNQEDVHGQLGDGQVDLHKGLLTRRLWRLVDGTGANQDKLRERYACWATFRLYHAYVAAIPSRSPVLAVHPSAWRRRTSTSLRGVPSGLVVSKLNVPLKPTTSAISSA